MAPSADLYDRANGFLATGAMLVPRFDHALALLPDGKVLVTGGSDGFSYFASAEIYDSASGTFSATGSMNIPRAWHTATLLPEGKILIAGGFNSGSTPEPFESSELYDPATGTFSFAGRFSPVGSATAWHYEHQAALLQNGKVLIAGGRGYGGATADAQLYDPATDTYTAVGPMNDRREELSATLLEDGTVLIAGGQNGPALVFARAELYDPASGTFSYTGSMSTGRALLTATLLQDGRVLVAGGVDAAGVVLASAELYDASAGAFSPTGSMIYARAGQIAALLPTGEVLVAAGYTNGNWLAHAELYHP